MLRNKASEVSRATRAARRSAFAAMTAVCTVLAVASCGGSSGGTTSSHATLVFDNLAPYTGPNAAFGPGLMAGCWTAAGPINSAGGILGHKVTCIPTDTRGDPADAVASAIYVSDGVIIVEIASAPTT